MGEEKKFKSIVDDASNYKMALNKPHNYSTIQIKTKEIHSLVQHFRDSEKTDITFGDVILHSIAKSLPQFPEFNSNYKTKLELYKDINIGLVVNLGRGLMTIIIKDTDKKSLPELSNHVKEFILKYIRKEPLEQGNITSTITVTNLSAFNSYLAAPPLYEHQSSKLSVGSEFESFEMKDGKPEPVKMLNLTLIFDGRIADCQRALEFLNSIKNFLEKKDS